MALLVSALAHRAMLAIALPGALLLAMYVANSLAGLVTALGPLRPLSVFHYYGSAIEHGIAWGSFAGVTLIGIALAALAALAFTRRDICT